MNESATLEKVEKVEKMDSLPGEKRKPGRVPNPSSTEAGTPISVRLRKGQKEKLKMIPNWQELFRDWVDLQTTNLDKNV